MIHAYRLGGLNIVLDVASGSIHNVDDAAFDAVRAFGDGGGRAAAEAVREKHPGIPEGERAGLISDIEQLKLEGKLFSTDSFSGAGPETGPGPVKALCLNVSHACNMSCAYCFAGRGEYGGAHGGPTEEAGYLAKAAASRAPALMPLETGLRAVDFLISNSQGRRNLDIDFFGGEPLLNWEAIKGIVRYARSKERGSGKAFRFTLTTNGLLIDDDVIGFTSREFGNVVLSLDGRPETNDAMRKLRPGHGGSYAAVLPKIRALVEARGGKGYYVRGTFTRENLDFSNDILHLADLGFTELAMEPVVTKPGEPYGLTMDDLDAISGQYEKLAEEKIDRGRQGRGFNFYHFALDLMRGPCIHKRASGCGVGTEYLAVTPGGDLYPCHQLVGERSFLMGDVFAGAIDGALRGEFWRRGIFSNDECRRCWARYYCGGGCAANAYYASGSVGGLYGLGCEMHKKRIECAVYCAIRVTVQA